MVERYWLKDPVDHAGGLNADVSIGFAYVQIYPEPYGEPVAAEINVPI